jgi:CheY-like chemotaxis protein
MDVMLGFKPRSPHRLGPLTILLAEDDENDQFLFQRALVATSTEVSLQIVGNGEEAISYLNGQGKFADRDEYPYPWLVITDLKMPRLDGFAVIRHLKHTPGLSFAPGIVLSASCDAGDIATVYSFGANSYLKKPHSHDQLKHLLEMLIGFWMLNAVPGEAPGAPLPKIPPVIGSF